MAVNVMYAVCFLDFLHGPGARLSVYTSGHLRTRTRCGLSAHSRRSSTMLRRVADKGLTVCNRSPVITSYTAGTVAGRSCSAAAAGACSAGAALAGGALPVALPRRGLSLSDQGRGGEGDGSGLLRFLFGCPTPGVPGTNGASRSANGIYRPLGKQHWN